MSKLSSQSQAFAVAQVFPIDLSVGARGFCGTSPVMRKLTLDEDQVESVRAAILLGLALLGEFKERRNAWDLLSMCEGRKPPKDLEPIDPVGRGDDVTLFAEALSFMQHFDRDGAAA